MASNVLASPVSTNELESEVNELAQFLYENSNRMFVPMFPWIFLRVLSKAQKVGQLFVPSAQNKTVHEGIVLATWRPFNEEITKRDAEGRTFTRVVQRASDLKPGDHVLIPHWAGLPIDGFSAQHYRVVKEQEWSKDKDGGVFGVVEYDEPNTRPISLLREMLGDFLSGVYDEPDCLRGAEGSDLTKEMSLLAAKIEERFLLIDRDQASLTLSGR
jgi:hypothetical protein